MINHGLDCGAGIRGVNHYLRVLFGVNAKYFVRKSLPKLLHTFEIEFYFAEFFEVYQQALGLGA